MVDTIHNVADRQANSQTARTALGICIAYVLDGKVKPLHTPTDRFVAQQIRNKSDKCSLGLGLSTAIATQ